MSIMAGIQGHILEVTVVGCQKLKDTELFSRQDPYVFLEYNGSRHRTRTCKDGGKNAAFQEKFRYTLCEGLMDIKVDVWNRNKLKHDDFIGNATISLQKVLSQGNDDCTWTLQTKTGRFAGEIRLILHYAGANNHNHGSSPYAPPQMHQYPQVVQPAGYPQASAYPPPSTSAYPSAHPPPPPAPQPPNYPQAPYPGQYQPRPY